MNGPFTAELLVEADLHGIRIDSFLVKHFRNYSSWRMQRLAAAGQISIDHVAVEPTRRVFTGERVRVRLLEPPDKLVMPESVPFRVIHEDAWLLVVDKPAGVIAHPTGESQSGTLANGLQQFLDARTPCPGLLRPGIVHRLDRQTSGLMVVALHHRSHAELSTAFESGRVAKTYIALVEGVLKQDEGTINLPIGRARTGRGVLMSARGDAVKPKPAITRFRVLERYSSHTLVAARPQTGRNHQIRVHFAQLGHPLHGDAFYAAGGTFRPAITDDSDTRHALHAAMLEFAHPVTGVWLKFRCRLPSDLRSLRQQVAGSTAPPGALAPSSGETTAGDDGRGPGQDAT